LKGSTPASTSASAQRVDAAAPASRGDDRTRIGDGDRAASRFSRRTKNRAIAGAAVRRAAAALRFASERFFSAPNGAASDALLARPLLQ
jgi:hypothetical protein